MFANAARFAVGQPLVGTILSLLAPWIALAALAGPASASESCRDPIPLAQRLLLGEAEPGPLPVAGELALQDTETGLQAVIQATLPLESLARGWNLAASQLCLAVVGVGDGEPLLLHHRPFAVADLSQAEAWVYTVQLSLGDMVSELLLIVEELDSGLWGASPLEEAEGLLRPGPGAVALGNEPASWLRIAGRRASPKPATGTVIRLVPPRRETVSGRTRIDAIATDESVASVAFFLDEVLAQTRRRRPFAAQLELAEPARPQSVRAVAYDRDGRTMGEDRLQLNRPDRLFRVRISGLQGDPASGQVRLEADVTMPEDGELVAVEIYRNEQLISRLEQAPFSADVPTPTVGPDDYLRAAARLRDGRTIDDVVLLSSGIVEQVEVNLVELQVVVTDRAGTPITGLRPEDFQVSVAGERQQLASLAYADDVPLLMGLVIDTSGSMQLIMESTKLAAARFLDQTLRSGDSAFVVDFDLQPRLAQDTTDDISDLLFSLSSLQAEGTTALYDAVVFSMVQFEEASQRKALVVLTDGDDRESRYGPKRVVQYGQRAGVPVYIIGLGALEQLVVSLPKGELRRITRGTGGRLYLVEDLMALGDAYDQIQAELRSQYTVTFYTDEELSDAQRKRIEVRLARPGLEARTVVGRGGPR